MKRTALGAAAIAAYMGAAVIIAHTSFGFRPVFDGFAPPQPYQYVNPPADLRSSNKPPRPLDETYELSGAPAQGLNFTTADGQVQLIVDSDAIPKRPDEHSVHFRIAPLDPAPLPKPSGGVVVQGNAYVVSVTYATSRAPVALARPVTVILRFPATASGLARFDRGRWRLLHSQLLNASLQIFAETRELGTFAAVGPPHRSRWWVPLVAAAAGLVAAYVGYRTGRRRTRKRPRARPPRRRRPT